MSGSNQKVADHIRTALLLSQENTALLGLEYKKHFTTTQRKKVTPAIVQTIQQLPIQFNGSVNLTGKLKDFLLFMNVHKDPSHPTPVVMVSGFTSVDDPIKDELQNKFDNHTYQTRANHTELMTYYDVLPPAFVWMQRHSEVMNFVRLQRPGSMFSRVWVFDAVNNKILLKDP